MNLKHFILLMLSCVLLQSNAMAWQKVGEEPFDIDGLTRDWRSVKEDKTVLQFEDLGMVVKQGLQREVFERDDDKIVNRFHDAIAITYDLQEARSEGFLPKDIKVTIQYADPDDGSIIESTYYRKAIMSAVIKANPDMVATGDVYDQASTGDEYTHTIEFLFPYRDVAADAIPIITVAVTTQDSSVLKQVFDKMQAKSSHALSSRSLSVRSLMSDDEPERDDDDGYTLAVSAVGAIGPVVKGFQVSSNLSEVSISVVDGFQAGTAASAQVEFSIWDTGDIGAVANGVTANASIESPIGDIGALSSEDGTVRGFGLSLGPAISVGAQVSRLKSQELGRGSLGFGSSGSGIDRGRDRDELDEDRDRNDNDAREHGADGSDHDGSDGDGSGGRSDNHDDRKEPHWHVEIDFPNNH